MYEEEFPSGEFPDLSDELISQLHHKSGTYHHPPSDSWDLSNGMLEGISTFQE